MAKFRKRRFHKKRKRYQKRKRYFRKRKSFRRKKFKKAVIRIINNQAEIKYIDVATACLDPNPDTAYPILIQQGGASYFTQFRIYNPNVIQIQQGDAQNQRNGDRVRWQSYKFRQIIFPNQSTGPGGNLNPGGQYGIQTINTAQHLRVWILKFKTDDPDGQISNANLVATYGFPPNQIEKPKPEFFQNFKILKVKEYHDMFARPRTSASNLALNNTAYIHQNSRLSVNIKYKIKLKNKLVAYTNGNSPSNPNNQMRVLVIYQMWMTPYNCSTGNVATSYLPLAVDNLCEYRFQEFVRLKYTDV